MSAPRPVLIGGQRYERADGDFYCEPAWTVELLADAEPFVGEIWDPCCGSGTIPAVFEARGYRTFASDIADRGAPAASIGDFLAYHRQADNIVTNPPFSLAERFITHALKLARLKVPVLVPLSFLAGQRRHALFAANRLARVYVLSKRPSMPPGGRGIEARGGKTDYCWIVFDHGHRGPAQIEWLRPRSDVVGYAALLPEVR